MTARFKRSIEREEKRGRDIHSEGELAQRAYIFDEAETRRRLFDLISAANAYTSGHRDAEE